MYRGIIVFGMALFIALAGSISPAGAWAQSTQSGNEIVTIQIDVTTPAGVPMIGTLVIERVKGTGQAHLKFNGTIEGKPASATANGTESWSGNGQATIKITEVTSWNVAVPRPSPMTLMLSQAGTGLITVNGVPFAASPQLAAPGNGNMSYVVTNSGKGVDSIVLLPRTGDGGLQVNPFMVALLLIAVGPMMIILGSVLGKLSGRRVAAVRSKE